MAPSDDSVRPETVPFQEAVRLVLSRVRAAAGESDGPDKAFEFAPFNPEFERREHLQGITRALMVHGLMAGTLRAHFGNDEAIKDIPGWVWSDVKANSEVWLYGTLVLDVLLPDEWQAWSGHAVFIDAATLVAWLDRQDYTDAPELLRAFDADTKPPRVHYLLPSEGPSVTLSEAISWIAFQISLSQARLERGLSTRAFGDPNNSEQKLRDAIRDLARLAFGKQIGLLGRYAGHDEVSEGGLLTEPVDPVRLNDFAQFDISCDGLRYGKGLTWLIAQNGEEALEPSARPDSYRSVLVNRAQLLEHFPPRSARADWTIAEAITWVCDGSEDRLLDPTFCPPSLRAELRYARNGRFARAAKSVWLSLCAGPPSGLVAREISNDGTERTISAGWWNTKILLDLGDLGPGVVISAAAVKATFLPQGSATSKIGPTPTSPKRKPGPAADPAWPAVIAAVTLECISAGYSQPLRRGGKAAIQTMLLSKMAAATDKHFSDDTAAKHAKTVIAALPTGSP